jgi:carbon storage regulator
MVMLVLSRKKGERVVIGQDVYVKIIEIRGDRVKLGFEGPSEIPIHREEIAFRITGEAATDECLAIA